MSRIIFPEGEQKRWLESAIVKSNLNLGKFALMCGVSSRTIRDWKREKYSISEKVASVILNRYFLKLPKSIKVVTDYWYVSKGAHMGGLERYKLYGPLGNIETRIKGGTISQLRRKEFPEKYRLLGCNVRKEFPPLKESVEFAEMTGIILGDGGMTSNQLVITLNRKTDFGYVPYVCNLSKIVFGEMFRVRNRNYDGGVDLSLSGINLIESLSKFELYKGDKVRRQVDFPKWIWKKNIYQRCCVRGLTDTDGCVFVHFHTTKGIKYRNLRICFSSKSLPLLKSVSRVLSNEKIKHFVNIKYGILNVYDLKHIVKYATIIGFSNPKHSNKYKEHLLYNRRLV